MNDALFTPKQVASALNLNYRTVLRKIESGELQTIKLGKSFVITKDALNSYLNNAKQVIQPLRVSVAIVVHQGKVLLVKRRIREGQLSWQFPAGRLRYKEKSSTRAEIECLQETGVHCKAYRQLGKRIHPDTHAIIHYWLCRYLEGKAYLADDEENSEVQWVQKDKVLGMFTSDTYPAVKKFLSK